MVLLIQVRWIDRKKTYSKDTPDNKYVVILHTFQTKNKQIFWRWMCVRHYVLLRILCQINANSITFFMCTEPLGIIFRQSISLFFLLAFKKKSAFAFKKNCKEKKLPNHVIIIAIFRRMSCAELKSIAMPLYSLCGLNTWIIIMAFFDKKNISFQTKHQQ